VHGGTLHRRAPSPAVYARIRTRIKEESMLLRRFVASLAAAALAAAPAAARAAGAPPAAAPKAAVPAASSGDLAAARKLFEANLDAIRHRDRDVYLACYLKSPNLALSVPEGTKIGYDAFAKDVGSHWPDLYVASDLQVVPVRPGLVYGSYRFRVRYGADEHTGLSERFFVKTDAGWKIAVTTAFDAPAGTPPPPRALVGATLIDGTGSEPVRDAVIVLRGGRIECAGSKSACPVPEGVERTDLAGKFIAPGLIDAHVHFSQTGWADGRPDALDLRETHPYEQVEADLRAHPERFFRTDLCSGVTAVFDVGGYAWTWGLRTRAEQDTLAPHYAAAGPLLSTLDHWLNLPAERQFIYLSDEKTARGGVDYLASQGADAVKLWFIPVKDEEFEAKEKAVLAAGDEAKKRGIRLIVHATELREAKSALKAGVKLLVHSVWDQPIDDEFLSMAKANGTIYCPTLTVIDGYLRMDGSAASGTPPEVDDPNHCIDPLTLEKVAATPREGAGKVDAAALERQRTGAQARHKTMDENLMRVVKAGIPVAMGTDAGNPLTLHGPSVYAEMEAMQAAGMSAMDVLVASTRGGARALGREADLGTLEKGKAADLIVLDADPSADVKNLRRLRLVMRGGVLRTVDELRPVAETPPATAKP
jgi:imidazolonepropionase-like amidohydrolase